MRQYIKSPLVPYAAAPRLSQRGKLKGRKYLDRFSLPLESIMKVKGNEDGKNNCKI